MSRSRHVRTGSGGGDRRHILPDATRCCGKASSSSDPLAQIGIGTRGRVQGDPLRLHAFDPSKSAAREPAGRTQAESNRRRSSDVVACAGGPAGTSGPGAHARGSTTAAVVAPARALAAAQEQIEEHAYRAGAEGVGTRRY